MTLATLPAPSAPTPSTRLVIAYLRESQEDFAALRSTSPEDRTREEARAREGQRRDCLRTAERFGIDPTSITFMDDWGRSANGSRPNWDALIGHMIRGRVGVILARSVDRLVRDAEEGRWIEETARRCGTRILTDREGDRTAQDDPAQSYYALMLAEGEARRARERAVSGRESRIRNGEDHRATCTLGATCTNSRHWDGQPPYGLDPDLPTESLPAVIDAYVTTRSFAAAARVLNERGVPTRRIARGGDGFWLGSSVRSIIGWAAMHGLLDGRLPESDRVGIEVMARSTRERERGLASRRLPLPKLRKRAFRMAEDTGLDETMLFDGLRRTAEARLPVALPAPVRTGRRRRANATHALSGLAFCPYDGLLANATFRFSHGRQVVGLFCRRGRMDANHPRPYSVSEELVQHWVREHVATTIGPSFRLSARGEDPEAETASLHDERARLAVLLRTRNIEVSEYETEVARIDARLAAIERGYRGPETVGGVDWTLPARDLNARLRDLIVRIELSDAFLPVAIVYRREPRLDDPDADPNEPGSVTLPNPDAERVDDGWRVRYPAPTRGLPRAAGQPTTGNG